MQSGPEAQVIELFHHMSVCRALLDYLGRVVLKDVDRGALVFQLALKPSSLAYNQLPGLKSVELQHDSSASRRGSVSGLTFSKLVPVPGLFAKNLR